MQDLNITLAQTRLYWQDPQRNADLFLRGLSFAEGTDLIVLPEMFTTGFSMQTELAAEAGQAALHVCRELARKTGAAVCGSTMFAAEDGRTVNRLVFQEPDGAPSFYDKRHLFTLAGEEKHYAPGTAKLIVEWKGWRILPLVCYDLRFPVWSRRTSADNYDLLLYTANWPDRRGLAWRTLARARAVENQSYVAVVNRTGTDGNGMVYAGDSMAVDYGGRITAKAKPFAEELLPARLGAEALLRFRDRFRFFDDGDTFTSGG